MKKEGIQVYNQGGAQGAPPPPSRKAPMLFKHDGFAPQRVSVEDIRAPEVKERKEFDLKWLETALKGLEVLKFWELFAGEPKPSKASNQESLLMMDLKIWAHLKMQQIAIPFTKFANMLNKSILWTSKQFLAFEAALIKGVLKAFNVAMWPIRQYVAPFIQRNLERAAILIDRTYQFVTRQIERLGEALKPYFETAAYLLQNYIAKPYRSLEEAVKSRIEKLYDGIKKVIEEKISPIVTPVIEQIQKVPDQIAMASLWIWNRPAVVAVRAKLGFAKGMIVAGAKWCKSKGKSGFEKAKAKLKGPAQAIARAVQRTYDSLITLLQQLIAWLVKQIIRLTVFVAQQVARLYEKIQREAEELIDYPRKWIKQIFLRLSLVRFPL